LKLKQNIDFQKEQEKVLWLLPLHKLWETQNNFEQQHVPKWFRFAKLSLPNNQQTKSIPLSGEMQCIQVNVI